MRAGKAGRFVIVVAGEPLEDQVFEVKRKTKAGLEGTFLRNGFTCLFSGDPTRVATSAEVEVAKELGQKNRPHCPVCKLPMSIHLNPLGGLMPWRCEEHGEPAPDSLQGGR